MEYNIGDIVRTKKVHPCGSKLWEITRVGVDFKLKCQGCRTHNNSRKTKGIKNDYKENRKIVQVKFALFFYIGAPTDYMFFIIIKW